MLYHIPTMEKRFITEALIRTKNNHKEASIMLGITTRTLSRKKAVYDIKSVNIKKLIKQRNY